MKEPKICTGKGCKRPHLTEFKLCPRCRKIKRQQDRKRRAQRVTPKPMTWQEYEELQG